MLKKLLLCSSLFWFCGHSVAQAVSMLRLDLVRSGGLLVLDANDNWHFSVGVIPDDSYYSDP